MSIFNKYVPFSKLLTFALCVAFFGLLVFDCVEITRLTNMASSGISLSSMTVLGTITSAISTFADGVILFAVKNYLEKAAKENVAGYDSKSNTISAERMQQQTAAENEDFGGDVI